MIKDNDNIKKELKKDMLSKEQLEKVSGGMDLYQSDNRSNTISKRIAWSPDEEPGNDGPLLK
jgi:hypothetical protein